MSLIFAVAFVNYRYKYQNSSQKALEYFYPHIDEDIQYEKITSEKHFEKVKSLFNVKSKEELQQKLYNYASKNNERIRYSRDGFSRVPFIHELIIPETIAIYR